MLCVFLDVWDSSKCCVCALFIYLSVPSTVYVRLGKALCFSGCVGFRQVLCVFQDLWDSDKCCVFVWMCGIQTSAVCLSGCVGLR